MQSVQLNRETLRTALLLRNWTQPELAKEAKISRQTLSAVCRGATCRSDTAQRIAQALGVTIEQLQKPIVI